MALDGTYAGLKASLADQIDRTDLSSNALSDFIAIFEANANTDPAFRSQFNRTSATLTTTAANNHVAAPSDFLTAESLILNYNNVLTPLVNYGTATALYTQFPNSLSTNGQPKGFIVLNGIFELAPEPDAAYSILLYYYQKIPALSAGTNWLSTNYPHVYLYGSLIAAEAYLGNDPRLQTWGTLYDNSLQRLQGATDRNKYSGGALSVKVDAIA